MYHSDLIVALIWYVICSNLAVNMSCVIDWLSLLYQWRISIIGVSLLGMFKLFSKKPETNVMYQYAITCNRRQSSRGNCHKVQMSNIHVSLIKMVQRIECLAHCAFTVYVSKVRK